MRLWRASKGMARTGLRSSFAVRVLLVRDPPTSDAGPPDPTGSRLFRANDREGLLRASADVHDAVVERQNSVSSCRSAIQGRLRSDCCRLRLMNECAVESVKQSLEAHVCNGLGLPGSNRASSLETAGIPVDVSSRGRLAYLNRP